MLKQESSYCGSGAKCLPFASTHFTCQVRTVLARGKVKKSIDLIETNDGHNDGHSTHNNKPVNATNMRSNSIHIYWSYALILWLNIYYYYINNSIKVAHQNLQISKTHPSRFYCCVVAVVAPPNTTINRSDISRSVSLVGCCVMGVMWAPSSATHHRNFYDHLLCLHRLLLLINCCCDARTSCSASSTS